MEEYLSISGFSSRVQQKKQLRAQSCQVFESLLPPHVLIKLPAVASTPLAKAEVALKQQGLSGMKAMQQSPSDFQGLFELGLSEFIQGRMPR